MIKIKYIAAITVTLAFQAAIPSLADISPTRNNVTVSVEREPINLSDPIYRAYATAGSAKFTFIIPEKFHMNGDANKGAFSLEGPQINSSIVCAFLDADGSIGGELKPDAFREMILNQHPNAKITSEFRGCALGKSGPGFELQWKSESGILLNSRVVFIPTSAGVLEVSATTSGVGHAKSAASAMNVILNTLNASGPDGKLQVLRLSNKM